jgi:hypothetical protein
MSLFRTLLGPSFDQLPPVMRQIHDGRPSRWLSGTCAIQRGSNWFAQLAAVIAGMPRAAEDAKVRVQIEADVAGEHWSRYFDGQPVCSRLLARNGLLVENLGPLTVAFRLDATSTQIRWTPEGGRVFGIPLPAGFFRGVTATETSLAGRYSFEVSASLPLIGRVIHYRGWLELEA